MLDILRKTLFIGGVVASVFAAQTAAPAPQTTGGRFVTQIPWAGRGVWLRADTHIHTPASDGSIPTEKVFAKAFEYGCQVAAITDHTDRNLNAATPEYESDIAALRKAYPDRVILAGVEWNLPPTGGTEHAVVLVPQSPTEIKTLAEFKALFDDYHRAADDRPDVGKALAWLAERYRGAAIQPVLIYDHPSRKREKSTDAVADIERWRSVNNLIVSIEGGPGHQGLEPPGDYRYTLKLIDGWDPTVARIGDAWDMLLQKGLDVGGAVATSDFHNEPDRWPCQFSETWLYAPDATAAGAMRALRAGSLFGVHGRIARQVELRASVPGLARPAIAGEVIEAPAGATVSISLRMQVPARDWLDQPNKVDMIELITITSEGATLAASAAPLTAPDAFTFTARVPPGGIVLRARGRRVIEGKPALMFHTNPIRIKTPGR